MTSSDRIDMLRRWHGGQTGLYPATRPCSEPTLKVGPSGVRAECACGWGGMPRYSSAQAFDDHARHVAEVQS